MESSGFFESEYDAVSDTYDRDYYAYEFARYFALFIGNGVFANPVNQLKVVAASSGLKVILKEGWAFINGYWYHNDADKELSFAVNSGTANRIDSVKIRFNANTRTITGLYFENETTLTRSDAFYDLKVAEVTVEPSSSGISDERITDTRGLTDVCGFVSGLIDLTDTGDLFKQYDTIFKNWFATVQSTLSGDVAGNLLNMIGVLSNLKTTNKNNLVEAVNEIHDGYLPLTGGTLNNANTNDVLSLRGKDASAIRFASQDKSLGTMTVNADGTIQLYSEELAKSLLAIDVNGNAKVFGEELAKVKNTIDSLATIKTNTASGKTAGALAVKELASNVTKVVYATSEPTSVEAGTIVAVYEE